ncbi:MAG: AMP-binding protein, partial [Lachnospiraceae bacterium]|nr:AMP-binding protein [Lachnospiraceae bacterium]
MITYETTKTIRDLIENAGEEYGSRAFLRYENNNIIYDLSFEKFAGICRIIGAWANAQRTARGHRIKAALFGSASTHYIPVLLGVMGSGNTAVPLDIQLDKEHLADCLNRSDIDVLFYDREHEPLISEMRDLCPGIGAYYSLQSVRDVPCLNDILRDPRFTGHEWACQGEEGSVAPEDLAMILFTSGTTGYSKGVMLSNGNLLDNVFSRDMDEEPGTNVYLSVLPIHHVFCISSDYLIGLEEGATVCINGPLSALTRHLILFEPTVMRMVPMIAKSLYNKMAAIASADPGLTEQEIFRQIYGRNLIRITCGGGGLPPELAKKYYDAGIKIGQGYGMSECSPIISSPVFDRPDKFASAGKKVRRCEIRTAADGELQVKSPSVMQGYYGDPELTKEAFTEDGWLRTGDLGYLDEEGFVYLTGRLKNLIILSNGENVAPEELEGLFAPEPIVQDILVFGEVDKIMCEIYPDFAYAQANGISDMLAELEAVVRRINEGLPTYKRILRTGMRKSPFLKTTSKKIIRDAFFKERSLQKKTEEDFKRPGNDEEQAIFKLCAETLGHRRFGVDTNLFENGLDSFGSIMLLTALQEKLGFS